MVCDTPLPLVSAAIKELQPPDPTLCLTFGSIKLNSIPEMLFYVVNRSISIRSGMKTKKTIWLL